MMMTDLSFYRGRKVFITGHTGFKGSWMCRVLACAGADVTGYSLSSSVTVPSLYELCGADKAVKSVFGDIRDYDALYRAVSEFQPEIVIHMAAQPIVRESYRDPVYTYDTNVMGTVNICEAVRNTPSVRSFVNVTTDKVYLNSESGEAFREEDVLNGADPYSNSKSCSELVTASYIRSFFTDEMYGKQYGGDIAAPAVSTCRAGNVIGGGDFAADRIIPDCVRAAAENKKIIVRNPRSIRPFQHVLEPVCAYLMIAAEQYKNRELAGAYNIGPDEADCISAGEIVTLFCEKWNSINNTSLSWENVCDHGPHEAGLLRLDCGKIKRVFGWAPGWNVETAIDKIAEWSAVCLSGGDVSAVTDRQIREFLGEQFP